MGSATSPRLRSARETSGVSYFAQIPHGQRRKRMIIDTLSQSVRSPIQAEPGPIRVSVASLRNMSGERKYHASSFNSSGRIAEASPTRHSHRRRRVDRRRVLLGAAGDSAAPPSNLRMSRLIPPSWQPSRRSARRNSCRTAMRKRTWQSCKRSLRPGNKAITWRRAAGRHGRGLPPPTTSWPGRVQRS